MYKQNSTIAIIGIQACMMVLLLCACSSFQPPQSINTSVIGQDTTVFRGKIIAPHEDGKSSYALARAFQARHKHRLAIEAFKDVIKGDPGNAAGYNGLGVSLDAVGDFDQAVKAYSAALSINPNLDYVLNNLGYSYLLQGRMNQAIESFKKSIQLDGSNPRYRNNLGLAYARSGKHDDALQTFKSVGDDASAHLKMGRFFYRNGYYEEAEVHLSWASVLKPADPDIRRAGQANTRLAQIHKSDQIQAEREKALPTQIEETPLFDHDTGGFYTIPPGFIANKKVLEFSAGNFANERLIATVVKPVQTFNRATVVSQTTQSSEPVSAGINSENLHRSQTLKPEAISSPEVMHSTKIEVSNGNGVTGMARMVGNFLRTKGITGYRLTNADHFDHQQTVIYYRKGFFEQASHVKSLLPELSGKDHLLAANLDREPIRVLIGRDLIVPFNNYLTHNFNVDVSNGNGVGGMAKRVSKYLIGKGFKVGRLTNATHFSYKQTLVFHNQGLSANAKRVADALPGNCNSRIIALGNTGNRVQVILGSDMIF